METATEPQAKYIRTLLDTRVVHESTEASMRAALSSGNMSKREASLNIDMLRACAWKPKPATTPASPFAEADAALAGIDTSFFAIPAGYVSAQASLLDLHGNSHLFLRVRNWNGRRTLSRVQGNVGGFSYWRIRNPKLILILAALIDGREVEFARNFHELTGKCGRCGADLTDLKSRESGFGPDCRKIMGI